MTPERVNELWVRFLSEEDLSPSDEQALLEALRADPDLRKGLLQDVQLDGTLNALGWSRADADLFVREFSDGLTAERDETGFVRRVEEKVKGSRAAESGKSTRRAHLRPPVRFPWKFLGLAAAGLFGIVALVTLRTADLRPTKGGKAAAGPRAERDAEEPRRRAETRLTEIEREREKIVSPAGQPAQDPERERKREAELARLAEEKQRIEREMREAVEQARKTREGLAKEGAGAVEPPKKPNEPPAAPPRQDLGTKAALATVEQAEGEVFVLFDGKKIPVKARDTVLPGQGIETGAKGRAVLVLFDGTILEAGPETLLQEISEKTPKQLVAKWLNLRRGTLKAEVIRQPAGQPVVIGTPHAEARVLGTTLRLVVDPGEKGSTRLEVTEGKVRLTRAQDGKFVDVPSGHFAVAATGIDLAARPLGVIAHYEFEEGGGSVARDSSGKGREGKVVGAGRAAGKTGRGLAFNGKDSYVGCGPVAQGAGPLTVTAWVRTVSALEQDILFQSSQTDEGGHLQLAALSGGHVQWTVYGGGSPGFKVRSPSAVNDGKWHHVAGVRTAEGTGILYMDGKSAGAGQTAAPSLLNPSALYIGAHQCCAKGYFNGLIDDVRVYDRALSAEEIAAAASAPR